MLESYINYASGFQKDNLVIGDVEKAISDIQKADEEHCAFWVGTFLEDEITIEVHKSLKMFLLINEKNYKYKAESWEEVLSIYKLLLENSLESISLKFK